MSEIKLDRPLYLAEDQSTVVEEGDSRAAFVLGGKGSVIKHPDRHGLRLAEDGSVLHGEDKAIDEPPKTKAIKGPKETK